MADTAVETTRQGPPDTRGPSAPLPTGILVAGIAALLVVALGTVAIQVDYAVVAPPITPECAAKGLTHFDPKSETGFKGAEGVCHIVTGLRSTEETVVLVGSMLVGLVALALGLGIRRRVDTRRKRDRAFTGAILGLQAAVIAGFIMFFRTSGLFITFAKLNLDFTILSGHVDDFVHGARNTVFLAFAGELGGIAIGVFLALLALSPHRVVRAPARVYINFFRGTPLIWQLSFFYFGVFLGLGLSLGPFTAAIIVFSLNTGAYAAEVFRAGIQSVERGQLEAARGLGMSYLQSMRYVILPQAVRRVIPPLMNEFVILIKDTALVLVLGLAFSEFELYVTSQDLYSSTFNSTAFIAAALGYLAITLPLIGLVNYVERRLRSGLVGVAGGFGQ